MGSLYSVASAPAALSASATKSLALLNPADDKIRLVQFSVAFDNSTAATAVRVDVYRTTTVGTPAGTSTTPVKGDPGDAAAETTALTNLTTEPTAVELLDSFYLPQAAGVFTLQYPLGREPIGAAAGQRIGIRAVTPASLTPNAVVTAWFEE